MANGSNVSMCPARSTSTCLTIKPVGSVVYASGSIDSKAKILIDIFGKYPQPCMACSTLTTDIYYGFAKQTIYPSILSVSTPTDVTNRSYTTPLPDQSFTSIV